MRLVGTFVVAVLMLAVGCAHASHASRAASPPPAVPLVCRDDVGASSFAFRSSFWLNLHNFLYREARAETIRQGNVVGDPDPFGNFAIELAPVRAATADERVQWDRAVAYYRAVVLREGLRDSVVVRFNNVLGDVPRSTPVEDLPVDPAWADALRAAAPVYAELWWPVHDAQNRAWIEAVQPLLDAHMPCLAPTMARLLGGSWPGGRLTIDVSVYASWFGAYTTLDPLHTTLSSTAVGNTGTYALESVLHETAHALLPRVRAGLDDQPEALSHMLLFYTAGELVRTRIPGHVPFGERFHTYDRTPEQRRLFTRLEAEWRPVLQGTRPPATAVRALAAG